MKPHELMGLATLALALENQNGFVPTMEERPVILIPKERPDSRHKYKINGVEILALTKFEAIKKYKKGLRK